MHEQAVSVSVQVMTESIVHATQWCDWGRASRADGDLPLKRAETQNCTVLLYTTMKFTY